MIRVSLFQRIRNLFLLNLGLKLISVVIAILLWGIVLGSRNVEVTKEVPLEITTPPDVVPANEIPDKIAFRLSGPKAFLRSILDRREEPIRVNLAGAKPATVTYRFFSDNIRVPIGVKVLSINPAAISIKLEYLKRKDIPVHLEVRGTLPDGYRVTQAEVKPNLVRIKGPESRVDALTEIPTIPVDLSKLTHSVDQEIPLDTARFNVQLDGPYPRVLIQIESISANFRIKNVDIRVISSYESRLDEKGVTVLVRGDAKEIESLDRAHVYAWVDLSDRGKGSYDVPVHVSLPKDISLVKVIPDHVHVSLY